MPEMVLNHVSVAAHGGSETAVWLSDLARGIAALIKADVARKVLRMQGAVANIWFDACQAVRVLDRDGYLLLMGLAAKVPVTEGLVASTTDRLLGCESVRLSPEDGEPLLLCAIKHWIAVGLPATDEWDRDQLRVEFRELLADGTFEVTEESIDNLTRSVHAEQIVERDRERRRAGATAEELWARRTTVFAGLSFGPEVEGNLKAQSALLPQIARKLVALERAARGWTIGAAPAWTTKVTPESDSVMATPKLREARRFKSARGSRELFGWHARVGSSVRIHIRFTAQDRVVEVGYIGPHLPV